MRRNGSCNPVPPATGRHKRRSAEYQKALDVARPGDTIVVRPGQYEESIHTVRNGKAGAPITLKADGARGSVVITVSGRVLSVAHTFFTAEGLVLDGQFGISDTVRVTEHGSGFILRDSEVRRSSRDPVDILGGRDMLIERCLIHHALNPIDGRSDAHGVVAGPVSNLIIRDSEIHTFSGDGFQTNPDRASPGWGNVLIERVRFWLQPLPQALNGFAAGKAPGENAVDTKASTRYARGTLVLRDVTASGFRRGLIANMAAFNLKEHVDVVVDGATVFDSEIAFRVRGVTTSELGGVWADLRNIVAWDVDTAFRYENDPQRLRISHGTLGTGVKEAFRAAEAPAPDLRVRNLLVLGRRPGEAAHESNLEVGSAAFLDAGSHDFRLRPGSPAVDKGIALAEVTRDRNGVVRPQGKAVDVGAFEWMP